MLVLSKIGEDEVAMIMYDLKTLDRGSLARTECRVGPLRAFLLGTDALICCEEGKD